MIMSESKSSACTPAHLHTFRKRRGPRVDVCLRVNLSPHLCLYSRIIIIIISYSKKVCIVSIVCTMTEYDRK
jgi:hypothetical protein